MIVVDTGPFRRGSSECLNPKPSTTWYPQLYGVFRENIAVHGGSEAVVENKVQGLGFCFNSRYLLKGKYKLYAYLQPRAIGVR